MLVELIYNETGILKEQLAYRIVHGLKHKHVYLYILKEEYQMALLFSNLCFWSIQVSVPNLFMVSDGFQESQI